MSNHAFSAHLDRAALSAASVGTPDRAHHNQVLIWDRAFLTIPHHAADRRRECNEKGWEPVEKGEMTWQDGFE